MTDARLTAINAMYHALNSVPCSCHLKTHYNYDGKGERICVAHAARRQWDQAAKEAEGKTT